MNTVVAVLSIILALLLLQDHLQSLLYYLLFTIIMVAIVFTLRTHLPPLRMSEPTQENLFETKKWTQRWKAPLLLLVMLIALFVLPLLLAWALDPYVWFILMVGFITGYSVAEILFYVYTRFAHSKKLRITSQTTTAPINCHHSESHTLHKNYLSYKSPSNEKQKCYSTASISAKVF